MKKIYTGIIVCAFPFLGFTQQQFENGGFESWENTGSPTEEPTEWSSLKTSGGGQAGVAPKVISKAPGRTGGSSIRMENESALGITANGILTNGRVFAPDFNPENGYVATISSEGKWNTPFTSRPDSLVGWYKYSPAGGDKGKVEVALHRGSTCELPEGNTPNDLVAVARFHMVGTTSNWKRFSVPFNYLNGNTPDYLLSVLTSGDSTLAVVGSVAYFDDLQLIYNLPVVTQNLVSNTYAITNTTGAAISVPYTVQGGLFSGTNEFIAELSDANGDFSDPIELGRITSSSSGTVSGTIPAQIQPGTAYRVRVRPSETVSGYTILLNDNDEDITITLTGSYIGFTGNSTSIVGEDPIDMMVYESPAATDREWKYSLTSGGPYESFDPVKVQVTESFSFANGGFYYVICESVIEGITSVSNEQALYFGVLALPEAKNEENEFIAYQSGERIMMKVTKSTEFAVYDALGRKLKSGTFSGTQTVTPKESGLYFIQFFDGQKQVTRKVIFSAN